MSSKSAILYGASGHCKVIIEILRKNNYFITKIYDDDESIKSFFGVDVLTPNLLSRNDDYFIVSIGNNQTRQSIVQNLNGKMFIKAIHPEAIISDNLVVGEGTVVMAGAIINADTKIGNHCIINTSSSIDHDCTIASYVHISPNATLCGNVEIGEGSQIGASSVIIQGVRIGKNVTVGAGSVIIRDVPDNSIVVGNPGRIVNK